MATKTKAKGKPTKKAARRPAAAAKSVRLKVKAAKTAVRKVVSAAAKALTRKVAKVTKVESRRTAVTASSASSSTSQRSTSPERPKSKQFVSAVHAYEAGIKLMHAEEFPKAIKCFESLIAEYPDEPEIQERAKVLIHACEKKVHEKERTVIRSADDHYNVGIADLNRRELDSAVQHLQHALKQMPKGDHIFYALAAAHTLQGKRDEALQYLKQAIQHRQENRFLALRDSDFDSLHEDAEFKHLVATPER
jgi:tetratricopeptide (TPR) repeat protein